MSLHNIDLILNELPYDVEMVVNRGVPPDYIASMFKPGPIGNAHYWEAHSKISMFDAVSKLYISYLGTNATR